MGGVGAQGPVVVGNKGREAGIHLLERVIQVVLEEPPVVVAPLQEHQLSVVVTAADMTTVPTEKDHMRIYLVEEHLLISPTAEDQIASVSMAGIQLPTVEDQEERVHTVVGICMVAVIANPMRDSMVMDFTENNHTIQSMMVVIEHTMNSLVHGPTLTLDQQVCVVVPQQPTECKT